MSTIEIPLLVPSSSMTTVSSTNTGSTATTSTEHKLYPQRWIIMVLFMLYTINGGMQWIQFSIINDIVVKYYSVSPTTVEWTSNIFPLSYILCIVPSLHVLERIGIRNMMLIATTGTFTGAWIKVFSVAPNRFYLVLLGQAFQAIFENCTFAIAARFTAVWFGAKEISIAGALALFGDQVGGAIGFKLPSLMIHDNSNTAVIEDGLRRMHCSIAALSTLVLLLIITFFKEKPPLPSSVAQTLQNKVKTEPVLKKLKYILEQPSFILILLSYGLCIGAFNAFAVLLNQTVLNHFPGHDEAVGNIGFVLMLAGMAGSLILGYSLDKTHLFKENAAFVTICTTISVILFTCSLTIHDIRFVYGSAMLIGFFIQGFYSTGVQMAIEVTYPITEDVSSAIMMAFVHMVTLILTSGYGYAVKQYGDMKSNIGLICIFSLSATFALFIPPNLKRQKFEHSVEVEEIQEFL
ncbi:uncharacterized MFS-type transporter C09D4.1-like isoform X2 [Planococcus citri]